MDFRTDPQARFSLVMLEQDDLAPAVVRQLTHVLPGRVSEPQTDLQPLVAGQADHPVLWVLTDPVEHVARLIAASRSVAGALAAWQRSVLPALEAARKMRRRLCLVDARALAMGEARTLAEISAHSAAGRAQDIPPPPAALFLVIASGALLRDAEAARLVAELAALRRGPASDLVDLACCEAALLMDGETRGGQPAAGLAELEEENRLLRENLAILVAESQSAQSTQEAESGAQQELKLASAKVSALQRQVDDLAALLAQRDAAVASVLLADQRRQLEARRAEEQARAEERARAEALQAELDRIYGSKSWRITGPLRGLRRAAGH